MSKLAFMGVSVCMLHFTFISSLSISSALHDSYFFFSPHFVSLLSLLLPTWKAWKWTCSVLPNCKSVLEVMLVGVAQEGFTLV